MPTTLGSQIGRAALLGSYIALAAGCGGAAATGRPTTPSALSAEQIDADPLALVPGSPVMLATVDARAFYASGAVGSELAFLTEKLVPLGADVGFKPSRDVDRILVGTYSTGGLDFAAVLCGRFDEAKIRQAVETNAQTGAGAAAAEYEYAGRDVFTVNGTEFTILTPKTALAGTQAGIRLALDRLHAGHTKRDIPPWAQETIDTPNAAATFTADFAQPVASAAIGAFPIPWAKKLSRARFVADFRAPGMHVAGTMTYADAGAAAASGTACGEPEPWPTHLP